MPKDYAELTAKIENPATKKAVSSEIDARWAEAAVDKADVVIAEAMEARRILPEVLAKLNAVEAALARPVVVEQKAPAKAKSTQARVASYRLIATAAGAEWARRERQTDPNQFVREALPGDKFSHARRSALLTHKAATSPATTTNVSGGADLVQHLLGDYITTLAPRSAMAQLVQKGYARRLDFMGAESITYPIRSKDTLPASFVQEGATRPVKSGSFGTATAWRHSVGVIAAISSEITQVSAPQIVDLIESAIIEDTSVALDSFFLDAEAAVAAVRPAGIMRNATTQAASGTGTIEDVHTDLKWILQQLIGIRAHTPVLLMNPLIAASLSMKTTTGTGISPFASELAQGKLAGLPVILSENVDATQVIAMDADNILIGVDTPEFKTSEHASLVMIDDDGAAPTMAETDAVTEAGSVHVSDAAFAGAEVRSIFQSNSIACRFIQPVSWAQTRVGVVFALTGVAW